MAREQYSDGVVVTGAVKGKTLQGAVAATTAAAGTDSTGPGALPGGFRHQPASGGDDTKGVKIAAADNITGLEFIIDNLVSNKILKVYPPTGGTINGAAANAPYSSASGKGILVCCVDSAANTAAGAFSAIG